jgi:hypothetical protein
MNQGGQIPTHTAKISTMWRTPTHRYQIHDQMEGPATIYSTQKIMHNIKLFFFNVSGQWTPLIAKYYNNLISLLITTGIINIKCQCKHSNTTLLAQHWPNCFIVHVSQTKTNTEKWLSLRRNLYNSTTIIVQSHKQ